MRSFVAVELPEPILEAVGQLSGRLRASGARVTWVKPENMHLTLRFLGEVDEDNINRLKTILSDSYRGMSPFTLSVRGVSAFPNMRRPSVVWVGAVEAREARSQVELGNEPALGNERAEAIETAYLAAESAARAIGLPPEEKAFHPHLTLARIKDAREAPPLVACLERERDFCAGDFTVRSVSLFSSRLTPHGPVYQRLEEFTF